MKRERKNNRRSLSFLEYAVFVSAAIAALVAMTFFLRQKTESSLKTNADAFSEGRQVGSHSYGGGGPQFNFPTLPGLEDSTGDNPPGDDPNCSAERLKALSDEARRKQERATQLSQEAALARTAVAEAEARLAQAKLDAKNARDEANAAWQAADQAQQDCDDCVAEQGQGPACDDICNEAQRLYDVANEKEQIARQKEHERDLAQEEVDRLTPIAEQKEAEAAQAQQEAVEAAEALEEAQRQCLQGGA